MIDCLLWLPNLITPVNAVATEAAEGPVTSGTIGFVVLAIIIGPVILLTIAAMFGAPRTFRVPGLFLGALMLLIGAIILGFAASGVLLKFIVPQ